MACVITGSTRPSWAATPVAPIGSSCRCSLWRCAFAGYKHLAMSMKEEQIARITRSANLIIGGALGGCLGVLVYFFYYYSWTHERSFTSLVGPFCYYLLPAS